MVHWQLSLLLPWEAVLPFLEVTLLSVLCSSALGDITIKHFSLLSTDIPDPRRAWSIKISSLNFYPGVSCKETKIHPVYSCCKMCLLKTVMPGPQTTWCRMVTSMLYRATVLWNRLVMFIVCEFSDLHRVALQVASFYVFFWSKCNVWVVFQSSRVEISLYES